MKWLLQNFRQRLLFALRNPCYAIDSLYRELTYADEHFLASITGLSTGRIRSFLGEPAKDEEFRECLHRAEAEFRNLEIQSADLYAKKVLVQYAAVRALQPEVVVETGVANGVSSAYLLFALHLNRCGTLYSIELGDARYLPALKSPGWVVPEWLKLRWKMLCGDSRELLPTLLAELGSIDIFIHDSLHTYDHMLWEFRAAFPHLRKGGLLFSDDARWNPAFPEFVQEVRATEAQVLRGVGFLRKSSE